MLLKSKKRLVVIKHIEREGPGLFLQLAHETGMEVKEIDVYLGQLIPIPKESDIFLSLGGPMGISDLENPNYPWLKDEIALIKEILDADIPFIGICLGAQLLAYASGGNVTPLLDSETKVPLAELGWAPIQVTDKTMSQSLIKGMNKSFLSLHWHSDRILLPSGAHIIASSVRCEEQIFRIGKFAYGLQCHLEILLEDLSRWIEEDKEYIIQNLGIDGPKDISKQNETYCLITQKQRLEIIWYLFSLLLAR